MKKLSIDPKMVAVVEGASPPFPVTYSLWKAQDGQKRLSLTMNLLSGIEGKAIGPEIDRDSIQVELKWPRQQQVLLNSCPPRALRSSIIVATPVSHHQQAKHPGRATPSSGPKLG